MFSMWVSLEFSGFLQPHKNHACRWTGCDKVPVAVNECVNLCMHGALRCTGVCLLRTQCPQDKL